MESNEFTYFPTKHLNPIEFSRNIVSTIIDFDLHAMFNVSKDFETWTNEFDFRNTFYSKTSNYSINCSLKKDGFLNYKLHYKSNDFTITLSLETFADMPNGILQLNTIGLTQDSSLINKIITFCKELELSTDNAEPFSEKLHEQPDDEDDDEQDEVVISNEKEQLKRIEIFRTLLWAEVKIKSKVYYFSISHDSVILVEKDIKDMFFGETTEILFENFLNNNEGHDFIETHFGDLFLKETIKIVDKKNDEIRVEEILKPKRLSYRNTDNEPLVYVFEVSDKNVSIGEFNRMNNQSGGRRNISFKDFIDNKSGHNFVKTYFDEKVLNEAIELVKTKLKKSGSNKEKLALRPNYFEKITDNAVYYVEIKSNSILMGVSGKSSYFGDSATEISIANFINKDEGKTFLNTHFDSDTRNKIIEKIKSKSAQIKENKLSNNIVSFEQVDGTNVLFFKINKTNVTIGEYNRMNSQGGGAKDISFKDFIEEKSEQGFVSGIFGKDVLEKAIRIIKERM